MKLKNGNKRNVLSRGDVKMVICLEKKNKDKEQRNNQMQCHLGGNINGDECSKC